MVQQVIILDVACNWNDKWVENSNKADAEEGTGAGNKWLAAIMVSCIALFTTAFGGIILLFVYYTGCTSNNAFISLTIVFCIALTAAQLSGEEGSLLASSCVSLWAVFLCYSAVSKNPNQECNPGLADVDWINILVGLTFTIISLCWVAWSWTAEDKMTLSSNETDSEKGDEDAYVANTNGSKPAVTGIVTGQDYGATGDDNNDTTAPGEGSDKVDTKKLSNSWRLNIALAAISCWTSMVLTDWGAIQSDGTIANSSTGQTSMWMIMAAQWVMLTLYIWTLIAPRVFPDRDFS